MGEMLYPPIFYYIENFKECGKNVRIRRNNKKIARINRKNKEFR